MQLITAQDYETALARRIRSAKRRIVVASMILTWGPKTTPLLASLLQAVERGVSVTLLYDRYSLLPFAYGSAWPWRTKDRIRQLQSCFRELEKAGARVQAVGKIWSLNPFAHRQHAKITIVDDEVFTFGGAYFADESFTLADYTLLLQDRKISDLLATLVQNMGNTSQEDMVEVLDAQNTLLFDGGQPGQSIIYDRACQLATESTKVYLVSQMCPSGKLVKALPSNTLCYFNRPSQTTMPMNISLLLDQWRYQVKNNYTQQKYIHAKFVLFELKNGTKKLISGSNNFSWRGVAYGTKEIALESSDTVLWQELYDFYRKEIAGDESTPEPTAPSS